MEGCQVRPWERHDDSGGPSSDTESQDSLRALANRYGSTRRRLRSGRSAVRSLIWPKEPHSTVLSLEDEAVIFTFRRHARLPLNDRLYALPATMKDCRTCTAARRTALPQRRNRAGLRVMAQKFDRSTLADSEVPRRSPSRLSVVHHRHNTLANIQRMKLAHDPTPKEGNHK